MKSIVRFRWAILVIWLVLAVGLVTQSPNMESLVREKGQINVPDGYPSSIAADIIEEHKPDEEGTSAVIAIFHDEEKLSDSQISAIEKTLMRVEGKKESLKVKEVTTHFNEEELEDQFVSKDGTTIISLLEVQMSDFEVAEVRKKLKGELKTNNVDVLMTGSSFINEDVVVSSQEGLKKTEYLTVGFILVVLILVFRSVVAPLIPLVTVGISYVVSQSIVAFLVDQLNFPLSNFTQIFMVAVLFGIGTDYCILLLSRFKEELSHGEETIPAIIRTYKTAGKTVFFSGIAVLIGFASIGFAEFKLYQSAVAVAIGVGVLLIALVTIVPFFMATMKKALFWPIKGEMSHPKSKLWGWAGRLAIGKPLLALVLVAVVTVPFLLMYKGTLSYNSLDEIGDSYESVRAFNIVSDKFGPGETLPVQIVLENDESMKSQDYLVLIEKISQNLSAIDQVDKIRSATRPAGEVIEDLYVTNQVEEVEEGLGEGTKGIREIEKGLSEAADSIEKSAPELSKATEGISELTKGTEKIKESSLELGTALQQIEQGMRAGQTGAGELKAGVAEAQEKAGEMQAGVNQAIEGYKQIETGISTLLPEYQKVAEGIGQAQQSLKNLDQAFAAIEQTYEGISQDANYLTIKGTVSTVGEGLAQTSKGLTELNQGLQQANGGLAQANNQMAALGSGLGAFQDGLGEIVNGLAELEKGIGEAADGQRQVVNSMPQLTNGLEKISDGQQQLENGFSSFDNQIGQLSDGLNQGADGLDKIGSGIGEAEKYLGEVAEGTNLNNSGIYIPQEMLENKEFQQVFDIYFSEDGKMATLDVVLKKNPYSNEAINLISDLEEGLKDTIKDTKLENVHIGISGVTSMNNDLKTISDSDYTRTVTFMIVGIGIILVVLFRSFTIPVYLIASLLLTYYSSISITEFIFTDIFHYPGINWAVPFFGFVILMALGVDYSIFLMDRFAEYRDMKVEEGIVLAMRNMGSVIMSAVVILAGTFAAMLPSGVLSLLQIATLVLTGLLLYAFVILPLFVPVMVKWFGKANWWPFVRSEK